MYADIMLGTRHAGRGHPVADYRAVDFLRQEIAFFEARLSEMGEKGDCAYEHAPVSYTHLQVISRMLALPVRRVSEPDGRRGGIMAGPVVADVGPQPGKRPLLAVWTI